MTIERIFTVRDDRAISRLKLTAITSILFLFVATILSKV